MSVQALIEAVLEGDIAAVQVSLDNGICVDDEILIKKSVESGNPELVQFFIDRGGDINAALSAAVYWGNSTIIKMVVEQGADVCHEHYEPIRLASTQSKQFFKHYQGILKFLLEKIDLEILPEVQKWAERDDQDIPPGMQRIIQDHDNLIRLEKMAQGDGDQAGSGRKTL
jgi:hypothetical protein